MKDRRAAIVFIVFAVIVVGGGLALKLNQHMAQPKVDSNPDAATTTSSTILVTSSTTIPANPTTNVDWKGELNRIVSTENSLFSNPDPTKVGTIMETNCSCYADTVSRLTNLKTSGWHVKGDTEKITASGLAKADTNTLTLGVTPATAGNPTVDGTGRVIEAAPSGSPQAMVWVLHKGQDGIWRISNRYFL